jgi:UDP-N-acetylmuramyl pentapeptide phosphotransferase/UDP-N-acetylglucosamine-1-phosphate transferase
MILNLFNVFNVLLIFLSFLSFALLFKYKKKFFFFFDNDYNKPQSFHKDPTLRFGGIIIFFFFLIYYFFLEKKIFINSITILSSLFFIIGVFDDLKFHIKSGVRLFLMFFLSSLFIYLLNIKIENTQFFFLNELINNSKIISILFVCLCLLFVVNGSNLIDGFNGLFIIHFLIILLILYFFNYEILSYELKEIITIIFFLSCSFLFFNFPKSRFFLGDGGAYFLGSFLSLVTIQISNLNKILPPFFFSCLLFYIFFEVFFSFIRKIVNKKNPLEPDRKHLHMLLFFFLNDKIKLGNHSNYLVALLINLYYFISISPLFFFYKNQIFCKLYFFVLLASYLFFYYILAKKNK